MNLKHLIFMVIAALLLNTLTTAKAQLPGNMNRRFNTNPGARATTDEQGNPVRKAGNNDSLQHRNPLEDSITIFYHYFDSTRIHKLDSSITDFYTRFHVPYTYVDLGNLGTAAKPLLFSPLMKAGWDAGFHAFDVYKYKLEDARFFQTTRPYTELGYLLGKNQEQTISVLHTQNRKSNLNFAFEYRFIIAPGLFANQNASHNNLRINVNYQSPNKRYNLNFILQNNKLKSSENGGLQFPGDIDTLNKGLGSPFELFTRLGAGEVNRQNPFNTSVTTGNVYKENTIFFRHSYDFGQKDSLVTDSVTYKLFYPRLRLQHTLKFTKYQYTFQDFLPDSTKYQDLFGYTLDSASVDTVAYSDKWTEVSNEFSIITYPQKNNLSQFLKLSATHQFLKGTFANVLENDTSSTTFNNISVGAEYRNRTKNQKWDIEAAGDLYVNGDYAGDYDALISLNRLLTKKLGSLQVGFQNVNRTSSFINNPMSAFPVKREGDYNKENVARLFGNLYFPQQQLSLSANYYAISNYVYFDSFFTSKQESALFNLLQVGLQKKTVLSRHFNWYIEAYLQQKTGSAPVNVPLILTRNRIAFEGNFFKNLFLSTGLEVRYYTAYNPDNYSPFIGQFFYQNSFKTSNRPDVNFYFNFRIKSFKAYIRFENLNSLDYANNSFGFSKRNFNVQYYPAQAMWTHIGIWWNFVN